MGAGLGPLLVLLLVVSFSLEEIIPLVLGVSRSLTSGPFLGVASDSVWVVAIVFLLRLLASLSHRMHESHCQEESARKILYKVVSSVDANWMFLNDCLVESA